MRKLLYFCFNKVSDFLLHANHLQNFIIPKYRNISSDHTFRKEIAKKEQNN